MIPSDASTLPLPVLVGVDGSAASLRAVDLAAREAALRRCRLRVVHAFIWPYLHVPVHPAPLLPPDGALRRQAERIVAEAVARARAAAPGTEVSGEVVDGAAPAVLLDRARGAVLAVIGDRGLDEFTGMLVGSVAGHLATHAPCPVLVSRGTADPAAPVLVGVDGSPANAPAVGFAFEQAALRGVPLTALHAWTRPASADPSDMPPLVYDRAATEQTRMLEGTLAGWREKYPDLPVRGVVVHEGVRRALIDASGRAQLVVVGSRGHGGFAGLLLGSVSHAVLHHAACPVAVVPHPHSGRQAPAEPLIGEPVDTA